jgi:hypothetical protein
VFCLLAFAGLRLLSFAIGVVGVALFPPLDPVGVPGWPANAVPDPGWHNLFTAWERFDALWFLRIAEGGYRLGDGSAAFFPLYPLAIRAVSFALGGAPFAAATLVSNGAFVGALVMTYLLTASELSEETARTTVLLLVLFPTSYFFLMLQQSCSCCCRHGSGARGADDGAAAGRVLAAPPGGSSLFRHLVGRCTGEPAAGRRPRRGRQRPRPARARRVPVLLGMRAWLGRHHPGRLGIRSPGRG